LFAFLDSVTAGEEFLTSSDHIMVLLQNFQLGEECKKQLEEYYVLLSSRKSLCVKRKKMGTIS
jgi:hypothetical protein